MCKVPQFMIVSPIIAHGYYHTHYLTAIRFTVLSPSIFPLIFHFKNCCAHFMTAFVSEDLFLWALSSTQTEEKVTI